ncbi:MAG: IS110 family transposase [Terracidiphilus sp.]
MYVRLVLAGRCLPGGRPDFRLGPRPVPQSHSRRPVLRSSYCEGGQKKSNPRLSSCPLIQTELLRRVDKNKNDRIDSEKIAHLLRTNLIPPAYVYPAEKRPLRALLRQRLLYVWRRSELLARIQSHQLAYNRPTLRQTPYNRDPWEEKLLAQEDNPIRQLALQNDLALIRHYDTQITTLEAQLQKLTQATAARDYTLLQTVPGIGEHLGLTLLYEIGDVQRFPTVKDFLSYCRLVKGTVASAGKIKGLRGAKLGNAYLRWVFGEAAVIAKRDHTVIGPLAQRLEAKLGNKFKANTVLAIKLARAVYFMLRDHTVFDPERLVAALTHK